MAQTTEGRGIISVHEFVHFQSVAANGPAWWAALSLGAGLSGKGCPIMVNPRAEQTEQEAAVTSKALPR